MPKFTRKRVVIEAVQYQGEGQLPEGVILGCEECGNVASFVPHIHNRHEGTMFVSPGDWIITGVSGEKYVMKPDTFAATYEPAE